MSVSLVDVNVLVALCLSTHQHHRAAHRFLREVTGRWATCPITEAGLVRLLLNPAVTGSPRTITQVIGVVAGVRQDPRWMYLADDTTLTEPLVDLRILTGHQQVTDVHLVNLAARYGAVLVTFDTALPTWLSPADRRHVRVIPT